MMPEIEKLKAALTEACRRGDDLAASDILDKLKCHYGKNLYDKKRKEASQ